MTSPFTENEITRKLTEVLEYDFRVSPAEATHTQIYKALSKIVVNYLKEKRSMFMTDCNSKGRKQVYYLSMEFLMGRSLKTNLYNLGMQDEVAKALKKLDVKIEHIYEEEPDAGLGNGGLGRLAACYLDSAATMEVPLDGYGIRYKYGLFKQLIKDGYQVEVADDWQRFDDPWCLRREDEAVTVSFKGQTVKAVPYDMAVIGCKTTNINTLRLWQAEAINEFDFQAFNNTEYNRAVQEKNDAENITKVLYPNDNKYEGKVLRLKQQYFFCSASLQDIMRRYKAKHGNDFSFFAKENAIQLNDTHPVCSIPELVRLLMNEGMNFDEAFEIARKTCAYTNHTVLGEALEKWHADLMMQVIPEIYHIICLIANKLQEELTAKGVSEDMKAKMRIVDANTVHMARLATYAGTYVNGVAKLHTEILKDDVLKEWYQVYPERFQNKTNGITQRRWLGLCNPELAALITEKVGSDNWLIDLSLLSKLNDCIDAKTITKFNTIKKKKKVQLAEYIKKMDGVEINPDSIYDIQVKRLHEYKRQLLNAFSIMTIYFRIKEGKLPNWTPTTFIFGAKAAPGYARAKAIIKYINEIADLVNNDPDTKDKLKVVFISNYNVSYAEKIVVAADLSEQTSTAGLEASGTGNMKFMLNGAPTLGTMDGANVEIVQEVGADNAVIFGLSSDEVIRYENEGGYDPMEIFNNDQDIREVLMELINGKYSKEDPEMFRDIYNSLLNTQEGRRADTYFILKDFCSYADAQKKIDERYRDEKSWAKTVMINSFKAGKFSSDRTIEEYATEIWKLTKTPVKVQ